MLRYTQRPSRLGRAKYGPARSSPNLCIYDCLQRLISINSNPPDFTISIHTHRHVKLDYEGLQMMLPNFGSGGPCLSSSKFQATRISHLAVICTDGKMPQHGMGKAYLQWRHPSCSAGIQRSRALKEDRLTLIMQLDPWTEHGNMAQTVSHDAIQYHVTLPEHEEFCVNVRVEDAIEECRQGHFSKITTDSSLRDQKVVKEGWTRTGQTLPLT